LDPDLDLEADLGVDTVKQAEVFAAVREHYELERDDNLQLRDFPTLRHVAGGCATAPARLHRRRISPRTATVGRQRRHRRRVDGPRPDHRGR
jgi:hypothetical protein